MKLYTDSCCISPEGVFKDNNPGQGRCLGVRDLGLTIGDLTNSFRFFSHSSLLQKQNSIQDEDLPPPPPELTDAVVVERHAPQSHSRPNNIAPPSVPPPQIPYDDTDPDDQLPPPVRIVLVYLNV